jgi:hypothetical protein
MNVRLDAMNTTQTRKTYMNDHDEKDATSDDLLPDLAELPEIDLGDVAGGRLGSEDNARFGHLPRRRIGKPHHPPCPLPFPLPFPF